MGPCVRCGVEDAGGWGELDGEWFCDGEDRSCLMLEVDERNGPKWNPGEVGPDA